jgi:hypothetical protein
MMMVMIKVMIKVIIKVMIMELLSLNYLYLVDGEW